MKERGTRNELLLRVGLVLLFVFAIYSNVRLIIRNHQLSERVKTAKADTASQEFRNRKLKLLIAYYQTPSYQDVEARRRLGLKKPDETVYVVKGLSDADDESLLSDNLYQDAEPEAPSPKTNISQWWDYFFSNR